MKYYIIAGEASGDLHASNLMKEIKNKDTQAEFRFWGGDLMQAQGGTLVKHYRDLAFMGFAEVLMNLRTILGNISIAKKDIETYRPDAVILVDYPGFNLRIAEFVKKLGIKVYYYISPQIWAWKSNRVHKIKKVVDKMFVILPFEEEFYQRYDYKVDFVGNPLLDSLNHLPSIDEAKFRAEHSLDERPIIAVLPGSRTQEIKVKLPLMKKKKKDFPEYQFVVAGAPSQPIENYRKITGENLKIVENKTYDLLRISHAALVTSGTATLETALLKIPEVVCYKGNPISYEIGKRIIKNIRFISLVNLIMDREVVKELIQYELTYETIKHELNLILNSSKREQMLKDYDELYHKLGGIGASERTANLIVQDLNHSIQL